MEFTSYTRPAYSLESNVTRPGDMIQPLAQSFLQTQPLLVCEGNVSADPRAALPGLDFNQA